MIFGYGDLNKIINYLKKDTIPIKTFKYEYKLHKNTIHELQKKYRYICFLEKHFPQQNDYLGNVRLNNYKILKKYNYGIVKIEMDVNNNKQQRIGIIKKNVKNINGKLYDKFILLNRLRENIASKLINRNCFKIIKINNRRIRNERPIQDDRQFPNPENMEPDNIIRRAINNLETF